MWKLLNLLPGQRRRLEHELARELQYHIDRRRDDLLRTGLSETEARRQVTLEFGGIPQVQEEVRDTWVWTCLDNRSRDLRYAGRLLRRSPAFAVTAVFSLALGIGAATAIFSLVDQVLLRSLPVREPDRLVYLEWRGSDLTTKWGSRSLMSYPLCRDLQDQQLFEGVFCRHPTTVNLSTGQQPEQFRGEIVSGTYFTLLGVAPHLGRLINPSDDLQPGGHPVVVVSHSYWTNHLGSASDVIGRKVLVNNYPMTVIGVAPAGFTGVDPMVPPAIWMPAMMTELAGNLDSYWNRMLDRRAAWMHVFGRLKPGATVDDTSASLQPWFRSMLESDTRTESFPNVTAEQRHDFMSSTIDLESVPQGLSGLRGALERPLWVLMAGTVVLLLLAAINVAGLLLARGAARAREFTTRMAIGATRARIASQLLVESLLIALAGGVLGMTAAPALSRMVLSLLPQAADVGLRTDLRVLVFAFFASVVTAVVCGLAPALQTGRTPLIASLNERSRTAAAGAVRLRKTLVAGQLAFTLVLLIGSGLFVQTLTRLRGNVGFDSQNLVTVSVDPPGIGYSEADAERVMRDVLRGLQAIPVVERSAIANTGLLNGGASASSVTIQSDRRFVGDRPAIRLRVGPGFFATLGTPVIAGRDFDERDVRPPGDKPRGYRSAIVNESFARRYFADQDPVGARLGLGARPDTRTNIEIIGVVKDFSRRSLRDEQLEIMFLQYWDQDSSDGTFYLRVRGRAEIAAASIRAAIAQVDPVLPMTLSTFDDQIDRSLRTERMLATLSTAFGALALLLAVIGLYGVMSFVVTQRTQEIGVRMALGATRANALWLIIRDASWMIAAGTLVAVPAVWGARRFVESQLFGVEPLHPPTIAIAAVVLIAVGLAAAMLPAWRAASVNPTDALRC
jgi:putative ABC transport system permease protein